MRIFYLNDRKYSQAVYCSRDGLQGKPRLLRPAESHVFDIEIKEGEIPYIKVWESNIVMISYVTEDIFSEEGETKDALEN